MDDVLTAQPPTAALEALFALGRALQRESSRASASPSGGAAAVSAQSAAMAPWRAVVDVALARQLARTGGVAALFLLSLDESRPTPVWQQGARVVSMLIAAPHPDSEAYYAALGAQRELPQGSGGGVAWVHNGEGMRTRGQNGHCNRPESERGDMRRRRREDKELKAVNQMKDGEHDRRKRRPQNVNCHLHRASLYGLAFHSASCSCCPSFFPIFSYVLHVCTVLVLLRQPQGDTRAAAMFQRTALDVVARLTVTRPAAAAGHVLAPLQHGLHTDSLASPRTEAELDTDVQLLHRLYVGGDVASTTLAPTLTPVLPGLLRLVAAAHRSKARLAAPAAEILAAYLSACETEAGGMAMASALLEDWVPSAAPPRLAFVPGGTGGLALAIASADVAAAPEARAHDVDHLLSLVIRAARPRLATALLSSLIHQHAEAGDGKTKVLQMRKKRPWFSCMCVIVCV